jgi:hypothetical protein
MLYGNVMVPTAECTDAAQLDAIFRLWGTPTEATWPGFTFACHGKTFPVYAKQMMPDVDDVTSDLLSKLLDYDITKRLTARQAVEHPYFA